MYMRSMLPSRFRSTKAGVAGMLKFIDAESFEPVFEYFQSFDPLERSMTYTAFPVALLAAVS